jgi:hypothetical protein
MAIQDGFDFDIPIGDVGPSLEKVIALIKSLSKELQSLNAIKPGAQLAAIDSMLPDDLPERTKQIKALVAAIKELHQTKSVSPQTKDKLSIEALSSLQQQLGGAMFLGSAPEESAKKAKKAAKEVVEAVGQIIREEKKLAQAPAMAPASAATPVAKDARAALKAWLDASNVYLKENLSSKSPLALEGVNLALRQLKQITSAALKKGFGDISQEALRIANEAHATVEKMKAKRSGPRERWEGDPHKDAPAPVYGPHPASSRDYYGVRDLPPNPSISPLRAFFSRSFSESRPSVSDTRLSWSFADKATGKANATNPFFVRVFMFLTQ